MLLAQPASTPAHNLSPISHKPLQGLYLLIIRFLLLLAKTTHPSPSQGQRSPAGSLVSLYLASGHSLKGNVAAIYFFLFLLYHFWCRFGRWLCRRLFGYSRFSHRLLPSAGLGRPQSDHIIHPHFCRGPTPAFCIL